MKVSSTNVGRATWLTPFADIWRQHGGGEMPMGIAAKNFRGVVNEFGSEEVARRFKVYCTATNPAYLSIPRFVSTIGNWVPAKQPAVRPQPKPIAKPKPDAPLTEAELIRQIADMRQELERRKSGDYFTQQLKGIIQQSEANLARLRKGQPMLPIRFAAPVRTVPSGTVFEE